MTIAFQEMVGAAVWHPSAMRVVADGKGHPTWSNVPRPRRCKVGTRWSTGSSSVVAAPPGGRSSVPGTSKRVDSIGSVPLSRQRSSEKPSSYRLLEGTSQTRRSPAWPLRGDGIL